MPLTTDVPKHRAIDSATEPSERPASTASRSEGEVYTSEALFKGAREVIITHAGATYRLRMTYANKLILTK